MGSKTIGVAVSDWGGSLAQGVTTLRRRGLPSDLREIEKLVRDLEAEKIVIGLPLNMNGTEGPQAAKIREFGAAVAQHLKERPVFFWDERLTTVEAERVLAEAEVSRKKKKKLVDKMAAAFILQGFLDGSAEGR